MNILYIQFLFLINIQDNNMSLALNLKAFNRMLAYVCYKFFSSVFCSMLFHCAKFYLKTTVSPTFIEKTITT